MRTIKRFFDLNNPVWRLMGFLSDMLLLTVLWTLLCLPIVTIGPSTAALFEVCSIQLKGEDQGIIKNFITIFIEKWKKTTIPGLISTGLLIMMLTSMYFYNSLSSKLATFLLFVSLFTFILFISVMLYVLPLQPRLKSMRLTDIIKIGFVLSILKLHWTLLITVTFICSLFLITYVAPYLSIFSVGLFALAITKVVTQLFEDSNLSEDAFAS